MAKNKIYLRPSADISIGHTLFPTESTSAYNLLNEEVCDSSTTYISFSPTFEANATKSVTSSFRIASSILTGRVNITSASVHYYYGKVSLTSGDAAKNVQFTLSVGENSYITEEKSYSGIYSSDNELGANKFYLGDDFITALNNHIYLTNSLPEISLSVKTSVVFTETEGKYADVIDISQIYIELEYNTGVYRKVLGQYLGSDEIYRKINGIWTKIDNGYETMQSILPKKGHHQQYLEAVAPTCTETGSSEGYKCSICNEYITSPSVIPAKGHESRISSSGHDVCPVCGHIQGMGYKTISYYGTTTPFSVAASFLYTNSATTVGNYAIFDTGVTTIDAYNTSLTRSNPTGLSVDRSGSAATNIGNYALFAGGSDTAYGDIHTSYNTVDAYNTSLTRSTPTGLSVDRFYIGAAHIGNYALFAGGNHFYVQAGNSYSSVETVNTVDAYNTSLTRSTPTVLGSVNATLKGVTLGNYAIFSSGKENGYIECYDASLTYTRSSGSVGRGEFGTGAATVGNYAIFAGGTYTEASAVDTSLTLTNPSALSDKRDGVVATNLGNYALFAGGDNGGTKRLSTIDAYNTSLTRSTFTGLSVGRDHIGAAHIGNYALFAGGDDGDNYRDIVDVCTLI